jgi:hypothetical protein
LLQPSICLTVFARSRHRHVVTVQHEPERTHEVLAQGVEVDGGDFERRSALVTREMSVHRAGEVEDRGVLIEVRVHDDLQRVEGLTSGWRDCTSWVISSAVRCPGAATRTSATVRLATVTRLVAPRIAERISLTSGLAVDMEKH